MADKNNRHFYEIYGLKPDDYCDYRVVECGFSVRTTNALLKNDKKHVSDLLIMTSSDLISFRGFGKKCIDEVDSFLRKLSTDDSYYSPSSVKIAGIPSEIKPYKNSILVGDFTFRNEISEQNKKYVDKFENAYELLDKELINQCINETEYIVEILRTISEYIELCEEKNKTINTIKSINPVRLKNLVIYYVNAYSLAEEERNELLEGTDKDETLEAYINRFFRNDWKSNSKKKRFIKWCNFNITNEIDEYIEELKKNDRKYKTVSLRSQKKTLEYVGKEFNVTRERIRQIEIKEVRKFNLWRRKSGILLKIYADRNGDDVLTPSELEEYFGEETTLLVYLLKNSSNDGVIYDSQHDAFIIGDESLPERVQSYVDDLPETFHENKFNEFVQIAVDEYGLSDELIAKAIEESYRKTGETYHRYRLTLEKIYSVILEKYYPFGMHIYDSKELDRFKRLIFDEFGIEVNASDRAIAGIIGRIGILCGRGRYRLKNKQFISRTLADDICRYIEDSDFPIFLTNTLFNVFEDRLIEEKIDNKYFLQGVLHDEFGDRWIFKRDYISKDEGFTSVYTSIVDYIKKSHYPVTKEEIFHNFPGITEIVVSFSVSDPEIINLFGVYIHSNKLKLSSSEISYLKGVLNKLIETKEICHCKEIFNYVDADYHSLLSNNYIEYPFSMYSLLEYLFRDEFNFSRPFIAATDARIDNVKDMLRGMVLESDSIEIDEIRSFSKENHLGINSILGFIDSCNDTHLLISNTTVMKIEKTGADEKIAGIIEDEIVKELNETVPISNLQCINRFPELLVKWSDWLIYSIIKKWGSKVDVAASDNQFRFAVPIVAPKGKLDVNNVKNLDLVKDRIFVADDLNDIDILIGDILLEGGLDEL